MIKGITYLCRHCLAKEFIPEEEFGIKTYQIKKVLCPICLAKGYRRKMNEYSTNKQISEQV